MDIFKKLACFALILAVLLCTPHVLRSFGLTAKDVVNALFSEKPREDAIRTRKESPGSRGGPQPRTRAGKPSRYFGAASGFGLGGGIFTRG